MYMWWLVKLIAYGCTELSKWLINYTEYGTGCHYYSRTPPHSMENRAAHSLAMHDGAVVTVQYKW